MATVRLIQEDTFLISCPAKNSRYEKSFKTTVDIAKISQSCRIIYTSLSRKSILEIEFFPFSQPTKKYKMLKPARILLITSGIEQPMEYEDSKWTLTFPGICECYCSKSSSSANLLILMEFNSRPNLTKHVMNNLLNLWETKSLADVTFKFNSPEDKDIQAHSSIIASGSPVLAAMFQNDFKEKQEKIVTIIDTSSSVFEEMLRFFYTGDANLEKVDATDLLIVANKYGVDSLKEQCAFFIAENLTVDNVIDYLVKAHLHEYPNLYESALEFMSQNSEEIVSRDDWLDLMKNYHELCSAAVKMMVSTKKQKDSRKEMKKEDTNDFDEMYNSHFNDSDSDSNSECSYSYEECKERILSLFGMRSRSDSSEYDIDWFSENRRKYSDS